MMTLTACHYKFPTIEEKCTYQGYKVKTDKTNPQQVIADFDYNCKYYKRCFHSVGKPIGLNFFSCPK